MKNRILSMLLTVLMIAAIVPLSAITAFAADDPITVTSIEIEAVKPVDGVEADISEIIVLSANGDEDLAEKITFMSNKLYWAEVPSLDPSDWGGNWARFTGYFEEDGIYSLHFTLVSDYTVAPDCTVTVVDPDGNVWWEDTVGSLDSTYVTADAVIQAGAAYEVINSVEITLDREIVPVAGQPTPILQLMSIDVAVNGSTSKSSLIDEMYLDWYFSDAPFEYDEGERFLSHQFWGGYYYNYEICVELDGDNVFADEVDFKVNTPTKTYEFTVDGYEDYSYCYGYIQFEEKTEGEPLKAVGDIDITVGKLTEGMRADALSITVGGENVQYVSGYDNGYNAYSGYCLYNHTDDCDLEADDVIEKGKVYEIRLRIEAKPGYTLADFSHTYANVSVNGIDPTFVEYRNLPMKEYIRVIATLPYILDNGQQITAPSMNYAGYADGANVSDVTVGVTSSALQLEAPMFPGMPVVFEVEGDEDEYIEKHEKFTLPVYLNVAPGFLVDGITKDMFIMNGMKPKFLWLDYSWSEGCPQICLVYELPVFHEHTSEWKNDATNHWNECACGDKTNVAAHEDTDNNGKCDVCTYKMYDIQYIYDGFDLILEGYKIGNPTKASIDGTYIDTPEDVRYFVFDHKVFKYDAVSDDWVACADTDVFEAGVRYMVDVTLRAETGYELRPSEVAGDLYDVTLNGIVGIKDTLGFTDYSFYLPPLVESGEKCPEGEIVINGYVEGNDVVDLSLGLPDGYTSGAYGVGFMLEGIESDEVLDNTGIYRLICVLSLPANYDFNTFSKETLTVFGCEPDAVVFAPIPSAVMLQLIYTLPDAPKTSDVGIDKIELTLNGYEIGASTDDVWYTPNESAEYVSEFSQFVLGADSYDEYIGNIVAGQKYYYMISIAAKSGYTLTSLGREDVTLNGKAPVNSFYEDGIFLCLTYELDAPGSTDTPGGTITPGGTDTPDDPSDDKGGLGAGAIVAIVIGSVLVVGIGGFAIFWFVIKKKSFAELIAVFKKN